ncbi:uncharacterized protein Dmul_04150 [Desulfococcus multivorans]|nr:uncharacterized protein Dmul_04150 [Desulfococcus multivorans]
MLNAFRHRRSVRRGGMVTFFFRVKCSTPFGIGDRCGAALSAASAASHTCSTPFGIGDRCGPMLFSCRNLPPRAQRLSASEIGADPLGLPALPGKPVLNAFRHRRSVRAAQTPVRS